MSKRFQRWVDTWIDENIHPHANVDLETYEARGTRLAGEMLAAAAVAGFSAAEIDEERERVVRQVRLSITDTKEFDVDAYKLKSQLAMENEDGD